MPTLEERQLVLEQRGIQEGVERYWKNLELAREDAKGEGRGEVDFLPAQKLIRNHLDTIAGCVDEHKMIYLTGGGAIGIKRWGPVLMLMESHHLAATALQVIFNSLTTPRVGNVAENIGIQCELEWQWQQARKESPWFIKNAEQMYKTWNKKTCTAFINSLNRHASWDKATKLHVGALLLDIVLHNTDLIERVLTTVHNKTVDRIQFTDKTYDFLINEHKSIAVSRPVLPPMLCEPEDWQDNFVGGYKFIRTTAVKRHGGLQSSHFLLDSPHHHAINHLQKTAFRVDTRNLEVVDKVLELNIGERLGLPQTKDRQQFLPPFLDSYNQDEAALKKWKVKAHTAYQDYHKHINRQISVLLKVKTMRRYKDEERFYCPWSCDWRGRFNPVPTHINPHQEDVVRGCLTFADGHELGADGWRELRIKAANHAGQDKITFDERLGWVENNLNDIRKLVADPLEHMDFWTSTDDPWQFLQVCREIVEALTSGSPESYVSHLPCNKDGTANALQHYSALGRDAELGKLVNINTDRPADLYSLLSKAVIEKVSNDAKDSESPYKAMAQWWLSHGGEKELGLLKAGRKIVKRYGMTYTYSVTEYGGRQQLIDDKQTIGLKKLYDNNKDYFRVAKQYAGYLANIIEQCLPPIVPAAEKFMEWFKSMAATCNEIAEPFGWTTPSGFKAVHAYRRGRYVQVKTILSAVDTYEVDDECPIDRRKQKSAVAPNVIHSFDAAHMALVVQRLKAEGVRDTFMIHDSFGCHARFVPLLDRVVRETFYEMYSQPVLERFIEEVELGTGAILPTPPALGSLDLSVVLDKSPYMVH